ncbi:MAG: hypothetical protein AB7U62_02995 [Pseudolabrys sp.]
MNRSLRRAEAEVLRTVLTILVAVPSDRSTEAASRLRQVAGALAASAETVLEAGEGGSRLADCFDLLLAAGVSLSSADRLRAEVFPLVGAVAAAAVRLSLVLSANIVADSVLRSRTEAQELIGRMNDAFGPAIDAAADGDDSTIYRSLVALHAAVTRDLVDRGRTLPQRVPYSFPKSFPVLALASRLYGDATRSDELIAENQVSHPAFMPLAGVAFSE